MFGMFFDVRNYAENATRLEYFHSFLFLGTTVSFEIDVTLQMIDGMSFAKFWPTDVAKIVFSCKYKKQDMSATPNAYTKSCKIKALFIYI